MVLVSIIIPTYKERENLPLLFAEIKSLGIDHEIIVVDDASPDGTAELAMSLGARVLKREGKKGLASAVVDGMKIAKGKFIAVMDADLQHPPHLLKELLAKAEKGSDIVIASRESSELSLVRKIISWGAKLLARLCLPSNLRVKDPLSGYFVVRRDLVEGKRFYAIGFKILLEILTKCENVKVAEVPYRLSSRKRGKSKLTITEIWNYFILVLKLSEYRVLKFAIVGISGMVVNMGILIAFVSVGIPLAMASAVAIECSILSNFILNSLWTFRNKGGLSLLSCVKYHMSVALGAFINFLVLLLLVRIGVSYILANLIGIFLGFLANYLTSEIYVWR